MHVKPSDSPRGITGPSAASIVTPPSDSLRCISTDSPGASPVVELIELEINRSHPSLKLRNGGGRGLFISWSLALRPRARQATPAHLSLCCATANLRPTIISLCTGLLTTIRCRSSPATRRGTPTPVVWPLRRPSACCSSGVKVGRH